MNRKIRKLQHIMLLILIVGSYEILLASEPGTILHARLDSSRTYMGYTRENKSELWIAKDKLFRVRRNSIFISRQDLKVQWVIDTAKMTYTEYPIQKERNIKSKKTYTLSDRIMNPGLIGPCQNFRKRLSTGLIAMALYFRGLMILHIRRSPSGFV